MSRADRMAGTLRERGSAAVEMVFAALFLLLFVLLILDFTRGFTSGARAQVAARHVAWAHGRAHDFVRGEAYPEGHSHAHPAAPGREQVSRLHFQERGGAVTVSEGTWEESPISLIKNLITGGAGQGMDDTLDPDGERNSSAAGGALFGEIVDAMDTIAGRGVVGWCIGRIRGTTGHVGQEVHGIREIVGMESDSTHYVSLYAAPEWDPEARLGWFDFLQRIKEWITDLF